MSPSNRAPCRLVCEDDFPRLKTFSDPSEHGNVCRKQNNNNYRCPRGCRKTVNGLAPFCSTLKNPSKPCRRQWRSKEILSNQLSTEKTWYHIFQRQKGSETLLRKKWTFTNENEPKVITSYSYALSLNESIICFDNHLSSRLVVPRPNIVLHYSAIIHGFLYQ